MKKFTVILLSTFCIMAVMYSVFVVVIDPFYVFHMPVGGMKPVATNNAHYVARGLIRNAEYDMLICGSSMCENFHIDEAEELFYGGNGKCLKVIQHGSYSNDLRASLVAAAQAGKADVIIMALDVLWKPDEGYRRDLPDYAINEPSALNVWSYLLNKDVLKYAVDLVVQNVRDEIPDENCWWNISDEAYSEENILVSYQSDILDKGYINFEPDKAWRNLKNIEEGIEACERRGIEIIFFIPPYSVANWDCHDYEAELATYKEIWRELLGFSNVSLYAIQFDINIITNFNNYRNVSHYSQFVSDEILHDIKDGKYLLTSENIDSEVDSFVKFLDEYDWDSLRKRAQDVSMVSSNE